LVGVLMLSSLLNIAYLIPIPARAFFSPAPQNDENHHGEGIHEAPLLCLLPLCLTALGCVVLFFFADPIYQLLVPIAQP